MRLSRASRRALGLLGVAAITAGGVATSSATFVATSSVTQGFNTKAHWGGAAVSIASPVDGLRTNDATPPVSGLGGRAPGDHPTVMVKVWAGGAATGEPLQTLVARIADDGTWSVSLRALADGRYTVRAEQSDADDNVGHSQAVGFVVDTTAPAPSITAPVAMATVGPSPALGGLAGDAAGDAATVTLLLWHNAAGSGAPQRTLTAARSGSGWSIVATPPLTAGAWSARVGQADDAGNSGVSALRVFTVDAATPNGLRIRSPRRGAWLSTSTPTIAGTASVASGAAATVTVEVYAGPAATGKPVRTQTTSRTGASWSIVVTPGLADGQYTARAQQADVHGDFALSNSRSFRVDTDAPVPAIEVPDDGTRVGARPAISGTAGTEHGDLAGVTVRIYAGPSASGAPEQTRTVRASGTGAWAMTADPLPAGVHTIQASQRDRAGNAGLSNAVTVTVTVAPGEPPAAQQIAALDGGGDDGHLDAGDSIAFTYSAAMSPSSMLPAWGGATVAIRVRFFDVGGHDAFTLLNAAGGDIVGVTGGSASSGGVDTNGNYVHGTVTFEATMVLSGDGRVVTVTLGAPDVPGNVRDQSVNGRDMEWTVNTAATDAAGNAVVAATVSENDRDRDF